MTPSYHDKQSWEVHKVTVHMSSSIAEGDSLNTGSLEVKAFDSSEDDVTTAIIDAASASGTDISITIKAGSDGADYNIRVRIDTTAGENLEDDLTLRVRDQS